MGEPKNHYLDRKKTVTHKNNHAIWLYLYTAEEKAKLIYYGKKENSGFQGRVVGKGHKRTFSDENNLGGYTGL